MPKIELFVSSKMQELRPERELLYELIPTLSQGVFTLFPWVFEKNAPASERSIRQIYLDILRQSALYIGMFWNEYGEWTIDEFERAAEWNIPRHVYVKNVDTNKRDPRLTEFLEKYSNIQSGITTKWFTTLDELQVAVSQSIVEWMKEAFRGRPGGSRASKIIDPDETPNLPRQLIGREMIQQKVMEFLTRNRRVLLQGMPGAGKTALAAVVATQWIEEGNGSAIWLLAGSSDIDSLFNALAVPFGAQDEIDRAEGEEKILLVRRLLRESGASLLVLDDAWNGKALHMFLSAVPNKMALLVTSRQRFALEEIISVPELSGEKAIELLRYHASDYARSEKAQALCTKLGNLPFALEIAGKTMKANEWTPDILLQKILDTPHELRVPLEFSVDDRQDVASLLQTSIFALDEDVRTLLMSFGMFFSTRITAEMIAAFSSEGFSPWYEFYKEDSRNEDGVLKQCNEAVEHIDTRLGQLIHFGLAQRVEATAQEIAYFRIHDLTYSYLLSQSDEDQHKRAVHTCIAYARRYTIDVRKDYPRVANDETNVPAKYRDFETTLLHLRPELENFIGAVTWSLSIDDYMRASSVFDNLYLRSGALIQGEFSYQSRVLVEQLVTWIETHGDPLAGSGQSRYPDYLNHLALAHMHLEQYEDGIACYKKLFAYLDSHSGSFFVNPIQSRFNLGVAYYSTDQFDQAVAEFERSLADARKQGDKEIEIKSLDVIATIHTEQNNLVQAVEILEHMITYYRESEGLEKEARTLNRLGINLTNLGLMQLNSGKYAEGRKHLHRALSILRDVADKKNQHIVLVNLGMLEAEEKNFPQALEYFGQGLVLARNIGKRDDEASYLSYIGNMYRELEQNQQAIIYFTEALGIYRELNLRTLDVAQLVGRLAEVCHVQHQDTQAIEYWLDAIERYQELGDTSSQALGLNHIGVIHLLNRDHTEAIHFLEQASVLAIEINNKPILASAYALLSSAYRGLGQLEEALKHAKLSLVLREEINNEMQIAASLDSIAELYSELEQVDQALIYYTRLLDLQHIKNNLPVKFKILDEVGNMLVRQTAFVEAIPYFEEALTISRTLGNRRSEGDQLVNIGIANLNADRTEEGNRFLNESLTISLQTDDIQTQMNALLALLTSHEKTNDVDHLVNYAQQAVQLGKRIGNTVILAKGHFILARTFLNQGQITEALTQFEAAAQAGRDANDIETVVNAHWILGQLYEAQHIVDKAIHHYKQSRSIFESLEAPDILRQIDNRIAALEHHHGH